jgi:hypothetical protein
MSRPTRSTTVALACVCASVSVATSTATTQAATVRASKESVVVFEGQLRGHRVRAVTLFPKAHRFHVVLTDGRKVGVVFPAAQQQRLVGEVAAAGVAMKTAKAKAVSHKRRYIAAGILIVAIALAVAAWLVMRSRRRREEEVGPRAR